jgi:hypothetical protein
MEPEAARATFTDTVATYRRKGCEAWLAVRLCECECECECEAWLAVRLCECECECEAWLAVRLCEVWL